ncbi:hypothetical protein DFH27DRAFT_526086 [Peziza echinospora]|nr:hypothetical protein DFH27DRAFT_526086 [Peziza echinospora]
MVASLELLADYLDEDNDDDMILTTSMVDALYGSEETMHTGIESDEETFMVDKRARAESATDTDDRQRRNPRRRVEDRGAGGSGREVLNPRASTLDASAARPAPRRGGGNPVEDNGPAKKVERKAKRTPMEKMGDLRSIRMMQGAPRWDYIDALRNSTVTIPWGTLMDLAPDITGGIAWSLVREKPKKNKPGSRPLAGQMVESCAVDVGKLDREETDEDSRGGSGRKGEKDTPLSQGGVGVKWEKGIATRLDGEKILQEPRDLVVNFYTKGEVIVSKWVVGDLQERTFNLTKILIDGGSVVNLISLDVARQMGLDLFPSNDLRIRTATNEIRHIDFSCQVILKIAGVTLNYMMLLGRRWLQQCRARGDYEKHAYIIYDAKGVGHHVERLTRQSQGKSGLHQVPEVILNPDKTNREEFGLEDKEYTELNMSSTERTNAILAKVMRQSDPAYVEKVNTLDWSEVDEDGPLSDSDDISPGNGRSL